MIVIKGSIISSPFFIALYFQFQLGWKGTGFHKKIGGMVKIDKRMMYKKIGIIFLFLGFLSVVETVISKTVTTKPKTTVQLPNPSVVPVATDNNTSKAAQKNNGKLSLEQIHALSQGQDKGELTRSLKITPAAQIQSDKFTQSQAHMSLPEIKKLIDAKYNTKPYQKMIDVMMNREKEFKDDYYVFYHGVDNEWRIPQDLYTRLYVHFKKLPENILQNFIFLRFGMLSAPSSVQSFLVSKLKENGLINDHELDEFLYAVNLALFGNVGTDPECTWQYFIKSRGHTFPDRKTYEKILGIFGLSYTYIDQLMALTKLYQTEEQTIIQIFVPKDRIDEIGYLAWIRGNPAHKETMDMILRSVENKTFSKTSFALDHYTKVLKNEQEKNPIFKSLLERVNAGDFGLNYFLKFYRNYPELIENINRYQARLIFTSEVLLNPLSGVKIFRYSAATAQQLQEYNKQFDEIFKKIIA
jgi:hypothetical protein